MIGLLKTLCKKPKEWHFNEPPIVNWKATNTSKYNMVTICKLILTQIFNIKDVSLFVATNDKMVDKFSTSDVKLQAILYGKANNYVLYLRSNLSSELLLVICHEMIHLKQYIEGRLKLEDKIFIWENKSYRPNVPYLERPWEKEANAQMYKIMQKVKKLYYE